VTFADISRSEAAKQLGISRQHLYRYMKYDTWPGDDAEWSEVEAWVDSVIDPTGKSQRARGIAKRTSTPKSTRKLKSKGAIRSSRKTTQTNRGSKTSASAGTDKPTPEMQRTREINERAKLASIEKDKTHIAKYQRKCLHRYREELKGDMLTIINAVFDELEQLDLDIDTVKGIQERIAVTMREVFTNAKQKANQWRFEG
jgi:hypothetical protein